MIDSETGVAGKINPGSRVNIFATFEGEQQASGKGRSPNQSKVIVSDAKVIDVGKLTPFKEDDDQDQRTRQREQEGVPITFALSAADAQRVAYAESFAEHVRLALVAPGDGSRHPRERPHVHAHRGQVRQESADGHPYPASRQRPGRRPLPRRPARQLPDSEPLPPAVDSAQLLDSLGQSAGDVGRRPARGRARARTHRARCPPWS